jgi:hypothetical protein
MDNLENADTISGKWDTGRHDLGGIEQMDRSEM